MWIIAASIVLALIGVVASRVGLMRLAANDAGRDPHTYWALGLMTLLPAWLVAFIGLLGTDPGAGPQVVWVLSVAAALIGAVGTEACVRAADDTVAAHHATRLWRLGVLAFLPAWVIVLSGHVAR